MLTKLNVLRLRSLIVLEIAVLIA